jgi:hypothetical protein
MDNENLDYVSSVDPYQAAENKPSVDVADEKALVRLVRVVDEQIELYHTISGMRLFPKEFNANQREAMCAQYVVLLSSLKQIVTNAIDGIKEKGK